MQSQRTTRHLMFVDQIDRICVQCGKTYMSNAKRFCTSTCYDIHRKAVAASRLTVVNCLACGIDISCPAVRPQKYCSKACLLPAARLTRSYAQLTDMFWPRVEKSPTCWPTTIGYHDPNGYGRMSSRRIHRPGRTGREILMSHVAWWLASGAWPTKGQAVLHVCDNPPCVRNDGQLTTYEVECTLLPRYGHLFLGTQAQNLADMRAKGRAHTGPRRRS